jgi:hypothetical protein
MIIGMIGRMGTGKTLSAVRYAYHFYKSGYTIYSNIHLKFPHRYVGLQDLINLCNNQTYLEKSVMLIDEVGFYVDSRNSQSKKNRLISLWIVMTRKLGVHVLYTSQKFHAIDRRLRDNTDVVIQCESKDYKGNKYTKNLLMKQTEFGISLKSDVFKSSLYYDKYDTRELVKIE